MVLNIVISAGGTGGHLIPAQQLAQELTGNNIVFMAKGLGSNYNFQKKFAFQEVESSPINKRRLFTAFFDISKGILQSIRFFLKFKPDVVVGFGSYYSFPVLVAAYLMRKPIVLFEANTSMGKVNRFFEKKAKVVACQFGKKRRENYQMVPLLPWSSLQKIDKSEARKKLSLQNIYTILVFGGSQGANFINENFCEAALILKESFNFQIIHLCGSEKCAKEIKSFYDENGIVSYVNSYEKDMGTVYSASDLAICRSGAGTICELIFFEIPSILIPLSYSSENHQEYNAFFMQEIKGGITILENKFNLFHFTKKIKKMMEKNEHKENLVKFKKALEEEKRKPLAEYIYDLKR